MIHAVQDNQKHLEVLLKFEPFFKGIYDTLGELKNTQDVMFAVQAIRTAQLWVNSCVVTSLKQDETLPAEEVKKEKPRIMTLS